MFLGKKKEIPRILLTILKLFIKVSKSMQQ